MAQVRKTRQQKIQHSLRTREQQTHLVAPSAMVGSAEKLPSAPIAAAATDLEKTQQYVKEELRQIGWISLLCFGLLLLATILLADFAWTIEVRNWLHLPHFVF